MLIKVNKNQLLLQVQTASTGLTYKNKGTMKNHSHQKATKVHLEVTAFFQKEQGSILLPVRHVQVGGRSLRDQSLLTCEQRLASMSSHCIPAIQFSCLPLRLLAYKKTPYVILFVCPFLFGQIFCLKDSYSKCQKIYGLAV